MPKKKYVVIEILSTFPIAHCELIPPTFRSKLAHTAIDEFIVALLPMFTVHFFLKSIPEGSPMVKYAKTEVFCYNNIFAIPAWALWVDSPQFQVQTRIPPIYRSKIAFVSPSNPLLNPPWSHRQLFEPKIQWDNASPKQQKIWPPPPTCTAP